MEKNIVLAIEKEAEYIQRKVVEGDNTANFYEYLAQAGYSDVDEFRSDKFFYYIKQFNIVAKDSVPDNIQPAMYDAYITNKAFCFFIECDTIFAMVPNGFTKEKEELFNEHGIKCYKYGSELAGSFIGHPNDFRFCIGFLKPDVDMDRLHLLKKTYDFLLPYYPELVIDNNDFMYKGKKVCGSISFEMNDLYVFGLNVSLVDMRGLIEELGIMKDKIPGCLPPVENIKELLKNEVRGWLRQ